MKPSSINPLFVRLRICIIITLLVIISLFLFSFTTNKLTSDFLQELGINKTAADQKIINSILGGYLDAYGASNAKNIALGRRAAIVKDLLAYTKQQVNGSTFIKEYNALKEREKPVRNNIQTPEEMRNGLVAAYKKSITETELSLTKADASLKPIFENVLKESKKQLKEAEDPNNEMIASYRQGYEELVKSSTAVYEQQLAEWETKYPTNHLLFVKKRLQAFLDETVAIDFTAQLTEKNGKKYFVNPAYEHKSNRWKMAFRAGREVVETARDLVQQWINEIK